MQLKGRWVSTHHPDKHVDGYINPRRARGGDTNDNRPPRHERKRYQESNQQYPPKRQYYGAQLAMHDFIFPDIEQHHDEPTDD